MVGRAGSPTGIVHADVTLAPSKVTELLKFQKLPKTALGFVSGLRATRSL